MSDLDAARQLLRMARKDVRAVEGMTDQETFAEEIFGFHAQQGLEKCLKAWLTILGVEYPKTHDLRALLALLQTKGVPVDDLDDIVEYNMFAVQFRYEAFEGFEESVDRPEVIARLKQILERVGMLLQTSEASS